MHTQLYRGLVPGVSRTLYVFRASYLSEVKNLLMPLFLMGCFPVDFQEGKRPLRTKSVKRPIKVGKRPINEGKRPMKAMVLVGISVGYLMGCFRAPQPWWKTAPLKRPIKRSMMKTSFPNTRHPLDHQQIGGQSPDILHLLLAGVLRGNTIRGNTTRNSERKMAL